MDYRRRILDTLAGRSAGKPLFVPRLDIWYRANKLAGTLPTRFRGVGLMDITDELGIGFHAVVPDFRDFESPDDDCDIGLGIYRFRTLPYRVRLNGVERKVRRSENAVSTEYATPFGSLRASVVFDEGMRRSGSTLPHKAEHAVKSPADFEAAAYILENAEVTPDYAGLADFIGRVGVRGPVAAFATFGGSPMHFIMKELMPLESFVYALYDEPERLAWLAGKIEGFCDRVADAAAGSPAPVVFLGANYDSSFTSPAFFSERILPYLKKQAELMHAAGKLLLTHTDGENRGLLPHYLESGADIADSVCPSPMTSQSLGEVLRAFAGRIAVWGGIPSISVVESSMGEGEFSRLLEETLGSVRPRDRVVFSIADTAPPGMRFERLVTIAEIIRAM